MEPTKRQWTAPAAKPITEAGSRADQRDVPPENGTNPSQLGGN
jgi:hypothetical protein